MNRCGAGLLADRRKHSWWRRLNLVEMRRKLGQWRGIGLQPDAGDGAGCSTTKKCVRPYVDNVLILSARTSPNCAIVMAALIQNLGEHCRSSERTVFDAKLPLTPTPLPSMPRAPRTLSAANPARSRSCGSRTPPECGRGIVGSYTHRSFRLSCPALISFVLHALSAVIIAK